MSLTPGTPVGRYVVRRKIAEGGMAEIFLAASRGPEGFEKEVVIKRIRSALADDPSFVQMFIAEARVASKLNHANVVHIFDFDQHDDSYYLAMEYVRGKSLAEIQRRTRERGVQFPPVLAAQVALEVARGLAYAHKMTDHGQPLNLVHRDVTPHNVLISYDGAVKLTDFGIAKAGNRATTAGMLKGKFAYMSPEQSRGETVDARTDIFALGITLWELLTQGRLFDGDSDVAVLRAVQERTIESPARLNPAVDEQLGAIVLRALQRVPANRFQTAHELERALQQYVITHTHSPDETDVGLFLRELFPEEMRAEQAEPDLPLQLVTPSHPSGRVRGSRPTEALAAHGATPGPALPPSGVDPSAFAFTRTKPSGKRAAPGSQVTEDGMAVPSVVTQRSAAERDLEAAGLNPGGTRKLLLSALGGAVVVLAGGALFLAGRGLNPGGQPSTVKVLSPETPTAPVVQTAPVPPVRPNVAALPSPPPAPAPREPDPAPRAPEPAAAPAVVGPPGYLTVEATPWGKLYIDGKLIGDVEGTSRRLSLAPGQHEVRLTNRKTKIWTINVESGKPQKLKHSFIDD